MEVLTVFFGSLVGFALGLTGGGGGIFAVPLLVYGLGTDPREAVGISLASVGGTALSGVVPRLIRGEVEVRTGLLFAFAGMIGAPIGSYLATFLPPNVLLVLFGLLMLVVAQRMWVKATRPAKVTGTSIEEGEPKSDRSACQRDSDGRLRLTSRCARLLGMVGLGTGILSGMFGVGGGFVIVPALVLFSGMAIHSAVATSLLAISLISVSGVTSYALNSDSFNWTVVGYFLIGGLGGMWIGGRVAKQLNGSTLQKVFAIAIVAVAAFVIVRSLPIMG